MNGFLSNKQTKTAKKTNRKSFFSIKNGGDNYNAEIDKLSDEISDKLIKAVKKDIDTKETEK